MGEEVAAEYVASAISNVEEACDIVSKMKSFKIKLISRSDIFENLGSLRDFLDSLKKSFKWFDGVFHEGSLENMSEYYYSEDRRAMGVEMAGYLFVSQKVGSRYYVWCAVVEFLEGISHQSMLHVVNGMVMVTSTGGGAAIGFGVGVSTSVATFMPWLAPLTGPAGAVGGGIVGAAAGGVTILKRMGSNEKRKEAMEEALGRDFYSSETDQFCGNAVVEALLLLHLKRHQKYSILDHGGGRIRMEGLQKSTSSVEKGVARSKAG